MIAASSPSRHGGGDWDTARDLDAEKVLKRRQASPPVSQRKIRLTDWGQRWLHDLDVAPKTKASYTELHKYILPVLGQEKVRNIQRTPTAGK